MKKVLLSVATIAMAFALISCGGNSSSEKAPAKSGENMEMENMEMENMEVVDMEMENMEMEPMTVVDKAIELAEQIVEAYKAGDEANAQVITGMANAWAESLSEEDQAKAEKAIQDYLIGVM